MSVLVTHNPMDGVVSAFGSTKEEAKANAEQLEAQLISEGTFTHLDSFGSKLLDNLYGWDVITKKIQYS